MAETDTCFSCGAVVPRTDGPTHDYMLSSPGCWQLFGDVLTREYEDVAYMANHQLTVDAYAVQHPGEATPAAARSVLFHLVSLCAVRVHGASPQEATGIIQRLAERRLEPDWWEPPENLGDVTVAEVYGCDGPESHLAAVERWADSAWEAWSPHHDTIQRWFGSLT